MKKAFILLTGFCLIFLTIACSSSNETTTNEESSIRIGTSSVGSTFYTVAVGISEVMNNHTEMNAVVQAVGGGEANMFAMGEGSIEFAITNSVAVLGARLGEPPHEQPVDVALIAEGQPNLRPILVRKGAGISKVEDLVGKKIIGKRPSLTEFEQITNALLQVHGIDPGEVSVLSTVDTNEAVEALRIGSVDAAIFPAVNGNPLLSELMHDEIVDILKIDEGKLDEMAKMLPPSINKHLIPANTYEHQPDDIRVLGLSTLVVASGNVSEEMGYEFTKAFYENIPELVAVYPSSKEFTFENVLNNPIVPFHEGAIRYFKEVGEWSDEIQSKHDSLAK